MPSIISLSDIARSEFDRLKKNFICENVELQEHIKKYAYSHQKAGLFQTYFYVDDEGNYLGYVSVASATIQRAMITDEINIPESMRYSIPVIKVTRLCCFNDYCAQGVGRVLMVFVSILAVLQQKLIGCRGVIVDSKIEAVDFYKKLDFKEVDQTEDNETIFMVNDILSPQDLDDSIEEMVLFCEVYDQKELIDLLEK